MRTDSQPVPAQALLSDLRQAALDSSYISLGGRRTASVHEFYRYPARFSPRLARSAIEAFTNPRDLVLDPFAGGGTTVVEAQNLGRHGIASDINALATFVTRAKTTLYDEGALDTLRRFANEVHNLPLRAGRALESHWNESGYWFNISDKYSWRIRNLLLNGLRMVSNLESDGARLLGRCALLRTGQWALDMRRSIPRVAEFRAQLARDIVSMADVASDHRERVLAEWGRAEQPIVIDRGLPASIDHPTVKSAKPPQLILTSPPYPGVYVNYHRWKVRGRRETPAPYWIIDQIDGHGMSHYTMSARNRDSLRLYFIKLRAAYEAIVSIMSAGTWLIQIVGFKDGGSDMSDYLALMHDLGLEELKPPILATADDGRLWRVVPGRRWWVMNGSNSQSESQLSREVVLVHRKR